MWIDYIKLKNFRQYQNAEIKFVGSEGDKNFNIIKGTTGAGKTNLLNAITWCFYGKELHLGMKNVSYPMVNTLTIEQMSSEDICEVKVEIQLRDIDDRIVVIRTLNFKKLQNDEIEKIMSFDSDERDGSTLRVLRRVPKKGMKEVDKIAIESIVPEALIGYFIFDGERLRDYFDDTSPKSIKEAVFRISQLEKLEDIIEHLKNIKTHFRKKFKKLTPKASEKQQKLEIFEKSLEDYKKNLEKLEIKWKEAKIKENEYKEKLRNSDVSVVEKLEEQRESLERELNGLGENIESIKKDKLDYILDMAPLIISYEALSKTQKLLSEKEESGEIPPDYKKNFIEKMLQKGRCICGQDISTLNEHRKNIEKILEECDEISNITVELTEENALLRGIKREIRSFKEKIDRYNVDIGSDEKKINKMHNEIEEISLKIGGLDIEKIKRWEKKRKEYEEIREEKKEEIGTYKANIEYAQKQINKLEREYKEEIKKEKKGKNLKTKLDFCDEAIKIAEEVNEEIIASLRIEIEKKTKEQFLGLIWKEKNYVNVIIDDDYNVSPIDQKGRNALGALSAGETQALALSFMAALNSVSGFEAPIVIDTPLGRIDEGKPKWQIAEKLPNYLKGKQVIMLVTSSEYTPEVRGRLLKKVGKEYRIEFEETYVGCKAWVMPYER